MIRPPFSEVVTVAASDDWRGVAVKTIVLCCVVLVAAAGWAAGAAPPAAAAIRLIAPEKAMLALINHARTSRGLHRVRMVAVLERAARSHSRDMLKRDYFSHSSYSGASYAARLLSFGYSRAGCTCWKVGEVIGWGHGGGARARSVFRQFMKSRAHRSVILRRSFRDVGVGAALGSLRGLTGVRMFTIDFGRRVR
ncbi:MAG: CAP domain-containing protein [Thermoleophilia bacterium]